MTNLKYYYAVYVFILSSFIIISCIGQVKTNSTQALFTYPPVPKIIRNFKAAGLAPDFDTTLVSQYIRSIFQDSKGNLWFGTLGEGAVRYDAKANTLTYFSNPDGFIQNTVYAINEDNEGNLWFGTDQGVYKYDPRLAYGQGTAFRNYNEKDGLIYQDITRKGILVDKAGQIWVGTHKGVYRYDSAADTKGQPSFSLFKELPLINVTGLLQDNSGIIWVATSNNGVFRYDPSAIANRIINITDKEGLGDNYAGGIAEDITGNIWFVMKNGICKYDPLIASKKSGNAFTEYTAKDGLGGTEFWGIYIEKSGIIWVTARGSTTRFDLSLDKSDPKAFMVFTPKDGLNCCVQSMYQDRSGNMWWGTGQGLYRFDGRKFYQVKKNGPW